MSARFRAAIAAGGLGVLREQSGGGKHRVSGERENELVGFSGERRHLGGAVSGQEGKGRLWRES